MTLTISRPAAPTAPAPRATWRSTARGTARTAVRTSRRRTRALHRGLPGRVLAVARWLPLPARVRRVLSMLLLWRPGLRTVPMRAVLLGGQNGLPAGEFARVTGDWLWPSRRLVDGPHVDLLRAARRGALSDAQVLSSPYADLARASIAASGQFFGARDDAGIVEQARQFVEWGTGAVVAPPSTAGATKRPHASRPGSPVLLAPVRDSGCYQVVDGHHRLAAYAAAGAVGVRVKVRRVPVSTPLQEVLDKMSWIGGEKELYQPVSSPELEGSWHVVRRCDDRMDRMDKFLAEIGLSARLDPGARSTYLDVASCYGWFLAQMAERGYDVQGVERDELGAFLGSVVHGLDAACVHTGDAAEFLCDVRRPYDVVSCFSLLHHVVRAEGPTGGAAFVRLLDRATDRVLFLDTGQAHEEWFADSLPEWDSEHVRRFLLEHSTFDEVVDLGADDDGVGAYAGNYGRTLFACVRRAP